MNRIEKVQKFLSENHLSALIIDNPIDLYYLTGKELSLGRLVIEPKQATLFVDGRYFEGCSKIHSISVVLNSGYGEGTAFAKWWHFGDAQVGFDADTTPYSEFEELSKLKCKLLPLKSPILRIREIKEASEIVKLKKVAELGSKGFDHILTLLKEGITEKEVALALELFWLKAGGEKLGFSPIIAFGSDTSQPHYHPTDKKLKKGNLVLMDIGVVLEHYYSDMTRVVSFGEASPELQKIYTIVHEAQAQALTLCKPGVKIQDVDLAARNWIAQSGYKDHFPHGLGHGVGLEIHESPRVRSTGLDAERLLAEGMVITIEPGVYLPNLGGVRLENTIVITKDGYEDLTCRPIPATLPQL